MFTPEYDIPPAARKALVRLAESVPPAKLRRTLRMLLLEYLAHQPEDWPPELAQMPDELICLFRLLDAMEGMGGGGWRSTVHSPPSTVHGVVPEGGAAGD